MNQNEQVQLAFEIYEKISRLESALWAQYYKQFLDIIRAETDGKSCLNDKQPDDRF